VAVLLRRRSPQGTLAAEIRFRQDLETLMHTNVDVVVLNDADLFLCQQVFTRGQLLWARDPEAAKRMKWDLLRKAWDYLPLKRFFEDRAIRRLARAA